jgi:ABC-type nitrate/sulfonate/bicarbonate transport system substrate-binding protein
MKTNAKTGQTAERRVLRRGITLALFLSLAFCGIPEAAAQKVRVAMPAKSMTFLNFYVGDKFGVYKAEGLDVSLEVIKTDVGVAGMVDGEIDNTTPLR